MAQPASSIADRLSKWDLDIGDIGNAPESELRSDAQGGALCHLQNGTGLDENWVGSWLAARFKCTWVMGLQDISCLSD